MENDKKAIKLSNYIRSLECFTIVNFYDGNYKHMGATISDAILQAGINYEKVVRPRIETILRNYPEAVTTSAFLCLIDKQGIKTILSWDDDEKPNRVIELTKFLHNEGIETEKELCTWITNEANKSRLLKVRGIGPKTLDYIKIIVGLQTVAVDQHMYTFLSDAGIEAASYEEACDIINHTADIMETERVLLDHSIWQYMSNRRSRQSNHLPCNKKSG